MHVHISYTYTHTDKGYIHKQIEMARVEFEKNTAIDRLKIRIQELEHLSDREREYGLLRKEMLRIVKVFTYVICIFVCLR